MKTQDLLNVSRAITELKNEKIKGVLSFKLIKIIKAIEPEVKAYESAQEALVKTYAIERDGKWFIEDKENQAIYTSEINEILNVESTTLVPKLTHADIEQLPDISPEILYLLYPIIE